MSQHTSANSNTIKLLVPHLETKENELTAEGMVYVKLQIEQLNVRRAFYVEPH
jgi:hypothetical protein